MGDFAGETGTFIMSVMAAVGLRRLAGPHVYFDISWDMAVHVCPALEGTETGNK
jgi:hypothetical protein